MNYNIRDMWLAFLLTPVFLFGCSKIDEGNSFDENPYDSFNLKPELVSSVDHQIELEIDTLNPIKGPIIGIDDIRVAKAKNDDLLILVPQGRDILYVLKDDSLEVIAEKGRGPNQIENGIDLISTKVNTYIIQQGRISSYDTLNKDIVVEKTFEKQAYYFEEMEASERFLVNTVEFGKSNFRIVDSNFEMLEEIGGKLNNEEKFRNLRFTSVVRYNDVLEIYAEIFFNFPYIALFNKSLEPIKLFKIEKYNLFSIEEDKFNPGSLRRALKSITNLSFFMPIKTGGFFFGVRHIEIERKQKYEFEDVVSKTWYSYYEINEELEIKALGNSEHYIFPYKKNYLVLKEGRLYKAHIP